MGDAPPELSGIELPGGRRVNLIASRNPKVFLGGLQMALTVAVSSPATSDDADFSARRSATSSSAWAQFISTFRPFAAQWSWAGKTARGPAAESDPAPRGCATPA